ncbi:CPBP family intramembrane glutamic endopeptidase [Staphylococcus aureus]|uniref:CPBP family intramembrane glutamic endopeptidase n=1 Tax=Staphylococcus aureus TaxID=1280 RepID=UPI0022434C39|nr:type II CAAX endopeptidase family protein [Staphylococcus aureus]MCW8325165.1 CPBP family intramembrane metalloprotease [Staphylococcus aureus]
MKYLKELFTDDHIVNNDPYFKAVLKSLLIAYVLFNGFALSELVTKSWKFAIISIIFILLGVWLTKFLKFNFLSITPLTLKNFGVILVGFLLLTSLDKLLEIFNPATSPNDKLIIQEFAGTPFILLVFSIAIVPAIVEELILRGFLLRVVFRGHLLIGLIVSSVVFALLHEGNTFIDYIPYFYFGIICGVAYLITKRIEVAIAIHFLNNFITLFDYFSF